MIAVASEAGLMMVRARETLGALGSRKARHVATY
jgi:hypothetical protein